MNTRTFQIDIRTCASAVITALDDMQGYLRAAVNPDRIALADLEMEPMGWTKRVYSQKAFDIWQKQLKLFPDDPLTLHHMAIMHHARAFDLEASTKPSESDADWKAAMGFWHRLYKMDAFWDNLTRKACTGLARQDAIKKLREDFPQLILAIHYDIALDQETRDRRKSRAKFHIEMAHKAPFDAQDRTEAQRAAFNRYIKSVPDEVWQPNELREEVLARGQNAIIEYLNFDPGCIPALEDALRLQRRIQRSRNTTWRALSPDDPQRKALLLLEKKDAEAWRPFFDQLATVVDQLEEGIREDLWRWYHGRGGDLCALDLEEAALRFYEQSVCLCLPDDDGRRACQRDLVRTMACVAREKAAKGDTGSKAFCDKVRARDDLTATACFLLAQAYLQLSLFDMALGVCDKGLKIEPDFDDFEADEWVQRLTELKQQIPIFVLMHKAKGAMESGHFEDAIGPLNEAEKLAKVAGLLRDHNSIYWLRVQAHLALDRLDEAKRDVELLKGFLGPDSSASESQALRRLEEMIAAKDTKPLLAKAKQAMEEGRYSDALRTLNEAVQKAPKNGVIYFLRCQAQIALGKFPEARKDAKTVADLAESKEDRQVAQKLDEMIARGEEAASIKGLLNKAKEAMETGRFSDALRTLNEAAQKAPKNDVIYFLRCQVQTALGKFPEARKDAKTVADLAESKEDRQVAQQLNEMIEQAEEAFLEFGGPEASKLRQEAISAFNKGRHQEAINLLNQAISVSKKWGSRDGAPKLKAELSQILTMAAISQANAAQEAFGKNISVNSLANLRSSMNEVKRMLEEAITLDRTNFKAFESLEQVCNILNQLP